jgi:hypothetical protein
LALEHSTEDVYSIAAQSAANREMTHILLGMVAERDRKIDSLQRQNRHITDEYRSHRDRTMRASLQDSCSERPSLAAVASEERASITLQTQSDSHLPVQANETTTARAYTTKHGTARRPVSQRSETTQYIPIGAAPGSQEGADA